MEYIICGQHRLPWSKYGDLQQSRADLMHFCMEMQKMMDLLYIKPTQPVDVTLRNGGDASSYNALSTLKAPASPVPGSMMMLENDARFSSLQAMFAPKSE